MTQDDLTKTAEPIAAIVAVLIGGEREPNDEESIAAVNAVVSLAVGFFSNVARIADALESIAGPRA